MTRAAARAKRTFAAPLILINELAWLGRIPTVQTGPAPKVFRNKDMPRSPT